MSAKQGGAADGASAVSPDDGGDVIKLSELFVGQKNGNGGGFGGFRWRGRHKGALRKKCFAAFTSRLSLR